MIKKIVSGAQTGVDRAALDVAIALKISHGGWCPKGRIAEDGIIDHKYFLQETDSAEYSERTKLNVRDSDGTLIISESDPIGGTLLTIEYAHTLNKPCLLFNDTERSISDIKDWLKQYQIQTLNIAGPRESQTPGIYRKACGVLKQLLDSN